MEVKSDAVMVKDKGKEVGVGVSLARHYCCCDGEGGKGMVLGWANGNGSIAR